MIDEWLWPDSGPFTAPILHLPDVLIRGTSVAEDASTRTPNTGLHNTKATQHTQKIHTHTNIQNTQAHAYHTNTHTISHMCH